MPKGRFPLPKTATYAMNVDGSRRTHRKSNASGTRYQGRSHTNASRANPSWYDAEEARACQDAQRDRVSEEHQSAKADDREAKRHRRTKDRAGRMYERQFGSDSSSAAGEGAPRAAVYKGKMGPSQRKANRMQGTAPSISARIPGAGAAAGVAGIAAGAARESASKIASHASVTSRSLKAITALLCLVLFCAFLYTPAQQYYQAQREHDRLTAEYASIEERNTALNVQNDILASEAGQEDAVRQKYGYIKPGEETAVVTGLPEETTDSLRNSEHIEANVLSSSVKAPEEWYTPILDALFGVE